MPFSSKNDEVIVVVRADHRLTIRAVAEEQGISFGLWQAKDFVMRHVSVHPMAVDSREEGTLPVCSLQFA